MSKTIFDYINAKEIALYYTNSPYNRIQYLGETLFPANKKLGLDLAWFKGSQGLPVILKPSAFDSKATLRDRQGFSKVETEMPFFREAMRIGEKDRQELNKLGEATNIDLVKPVLRNIYNDAGQLVESSKVAAEIMRMQLLSTGKINIHDNRMKYEYDFQHPEEHKETLVTDATWDKADSNPIEDLIRWCDIVEENTGDRPSRAIMTRKTFNAMLNNTYIKQLLYPGADTSRVVITEPQLRERIQTMTGLTIAIYNKKYALADGSSENYFPDGIVTLLPDGFLGNTWYGTTPEESDLMSGATDAQVSIVNTGIALTTIKEPHPVNVMTIVSGIFLPSFEKIDSTFIAKVLE